MTFAATSSVTAKGPGGKGGVPCRPVHNALGGRSARYSLQHTSRGKSNQFKVSMATDSGVFPFFPNAAHLTKAVAYLGGGSEFLPAESPLFLQINHTHSQPLSNSVLRSSEIGMGEFACLKNILAEVQKCLPL